MYQTAKQGFMAPLGSLRKMKPKIKVVHRDTSSEQNEKLNSCIKAVL